MVNPEAGGLHEASLGSKGLLEVLGTAGFWPFRGLQKAWVCVCVPKMYVSLDARGCSYSTASTFVLNKMKNTEGHGDLFHSFTMSL